MAVVEFLEDAAELAESISSAMTAADTPTPPSAGGNWMPVTVVNHTQFLLTPADSYFDSGRFQVAPSLIAPFKAFTFSVSATDNSILTGVTGAMAYTFSPKQGVTCRLGVGFSNPEIGGYKANVAFDADMNQAENSNPVLQLIQDFTVGTYNGKTTSIIQTTSANFTGVDKTGAPLTIDFLGSSSPGAHPVVTIVQQIVPGS